MRNQAIARRSEPVAGVGSPDPPRTPPSPDTATLIAACVEAYCAPRVSPHAKMRRATAAAAGLLRNTLDADLAAPILALIASARLTMAARHPATPLPPRPRKAVDKLLRAARLPPAERGKVRGIVEKQLGRDDIERRIAVLDAVRTRPRGVHWEWYTPLSEDEKRIADQYIELTPKRLSAERARLENKRRRFM